MNAQYKLSETVRHARHGFLEDGPPLLQYGRTCAECAPWRVPERQPALVRLAFRPCSNDGGPATCGAQLARRLQRFTLCLSVSKDEEYVVATLMGEPRPIELGARNHNFFLLTLARRRLADAAQGLPETSCGWIHAEDVNYEPGLSRTKLNVDVFRIRAQFRETGFVDGAGIVERRLGSGQLRIGIARISIASI